MSVDAWILLDLLAGMVGAAAWVAAGVTAATGRPRAALMLSAVASAATVARVVTVAVLATAGWWFVQEKVTLTLPLAVTTSAVAVVVAARARLARRAVPPAGVVALLTAGYAAVAGLAVTLLCGYPLAWSGGLIAVALVAAAATLTARVLSVPRLRAPAVAASVLALVGAGLLLVAPAPAPVPDTGTAVAELRGPTEPAPGATVRRYALTARTAEVTLGSGRRVAAWTFNGQVPGPPITARVGDLIEVTLHNADIAAGVTLHWHGYDVPAGEDGVPGLTQEPVRPGQEFVYRFRADQAGTYWYHTHEVSDLGVRMGLYGTLVVAGPDGAGPPPAGLDLTIAVHTFDGTVVFGDQDGVRSTTVAPGTPVRLRLVNTDNNPRTFGVSGAPFRVTAVDGTDLHEPGEVERVGVRVPAGGRADVVLTMPTGPVTLAVAGAGSAGVRLAPGSPMESTVDTDPGTLPVLDLLHYGTPAPTSPTGAAFDRDFTLVLDRGLALVNGAPAFAHTVNGKAYPAIPTEQVRMGDRVRFTIVNRSREIHPWHLHGHHVLVLSRDGRPPTGSPLWMDTFDVRPGEVWQVAFVADNPGVWMNHCHNLPHAEQGMALHLRYVGVQDGHGAHGG